jgi:transposase
MNKSYREIAAELGTSHSFVRKVCNLFSIGGNTLVALKLKARGRNYGAERKLSIEQEATILNILVEGIPGQPKEGPWLRSYVIVQSVIEREVGITLPLRTVLGYLMQWGGKPRNPIERVQHLERIKAWQSSMYPEIAEQADKERTTIHWCDIVSVESNFCTKLLGYESSIWMISTVTNGGRARFMLSTVPISERVIRLFLNRLAR